MYYGIPFGMLLQIALLALLWKSIRLGVRSRNPGAAFLVVVMMAAMIGSEFLVSSTSAAAFGFLLAILARIEGMSPQAAPAVRARPAAPPVPVRPSRPVPPGPGDRPGPSQGPEAVRAEPL